MLHGEKTPCPTNTIETFSKPVTISQNNNNNKPQKKPKPQKPEKQVFAIFRSFATRSQNTLFALSGFIAFTMSKKPF